MSAAVDLRGLALVLAVLVGLAACTQASSGSTGPSPCERFTEEEAASLLGGAVTRLDPATVYLGSEGMVGPLDERAGVGDTAFADRVCTYGLVGRTHEVAATYWLTYYPFADAEEFHAAVSGRGVVSLDGPGIAAVYRSDDAESSVSVLVSDPDEPGHEQGNAFDIIVTGLPVPRDELVEVTAAVAERH